MKHLKYVIPAVFLFNISITTDSVAQSFNPLLGPQAPPKSAMLHMSSKNVRVHRPETNQSSLSQPSSQSPSDIVKGFLNTQNLRFDAYSQLKLEKEFVNDKNRTTHVRMTQEVNGLTIYGTYVKAALNRSGELVHVIENVVAPSVRQIKPSTITAEQALSATLSKHYPKRSLIASPSLTERNTTVFVKESFFYSEPKATRVAIPMIDGSLEEGFLVETWDQDNILRHTLVNRFGRVLNVEMRTNSDSYHIFPDSPATNTSQTTVQGPGLGNTESPIGWIFGDTTTGNNVDAYLDRNADNIPDIDGRPISLTQDFLAITDITTDPTTSTNQSAATQNLFYFNNLIHDTLYRHGFTEAVGNFQEDNFGLGGIGGDSVNAEVQDGSGFNNANFATPLDGNNPRMQMYLWNFTSPNRDSGLDSDIIWHEYGHGLTWRMIGSMGGRLSGAIGEGMSDTLAILMNEDDVVGEWSFNNPNGIRSFPYSGYPRTYGDIAGFSVHSDGEIYAATMWRLWELWQENDLPKDLLLDYIVGGMNFTPANPAYEDMRDGILAGISDITHQCLVWEAFAQFGIGDGAEGVDAGSSVTITESFLVHPVCTEDDPIPPAEVIDLTVESMGARSAILIWTATGDDGITGTASNYDLRYSLDPITNVNFDNATPVTGLPFPNPSGTIESTTVTGLLPNSVYYFAIKVLDNVNNPSPISNVTSGTTLLLATIFKDDLENGIANWSITGTVGPLGLPLWHTASHRFSSPTTAFYYGIDDALNYSTGGTNSGQITSIPIDLNDISQPELVFNHYLRTENLAPYDAASVEVSHDNGATWTQVFLTSLSTTGVDMVQQVVDLSAFEGQIIQLRFAFDTVDSAINQFEGWVIDDIRIDGSALFGDLPPIANAGGPYNSALGQPVIFDGSASFDPEGQPLNYFWDFDDGNIANGETPSHIYSAPGSYTITLIVDDGIQPSLFATSTVEVLLPEANPGGPYSGGVTQMISFDGTQSAGFSGNPLNYFWDFGDGNTDTGATPNHSYNNAGTYSVTLVVDDGFVASEPVSTSVNIELPTANAGGPYETLIGNAVTFDGSASFGTSGNPLNYFWDFGDGNTGTGVAPIHSYTLDGNYTVALVVDDGYIASQPATGNVTISPLPNIAPIIDAVSAAPLSILDVEVSQLNVAATDPDNGPVALFYNWIVPAGMGSVDNPSSATPIFTPADVNETTDVTITVEVSDGIATVSDSIVVTVEDAPSSPVLLSTNFDNDSLEGWTIIDEGASQGPSDWSVISGRLVQDSNIYSGPTGAASLDKLGTYLTYDDGVNWTDYHASFTLNSGDNDALGFMFRVQNSNNYYRFSWDTSRNYRRLVKRLNGVTSLLAGDTVSYTQNTTYLVELSVVGSAIELSIDGELVFQAVDNDISTGSIAFYTWGNTDSEFDNLTVETLNGNGSNTAPTINSVTATPASINDAQSSQLTVFASDIESPPAALIYNWIVPAGMGSVDNTSSATPIFTPADVSETTDVTITVEVSDGIATVSDSIVVTVDDAPSSPVLLSTNFDDSSLEGWTVIDEGASQGPSDWSAASGSLVQDSNIYSAPTGAASLDKLGTYLTYDNGVNWTDYRASFTLSSGDNDALGFMFRVQDSDNYYRFSWDTSRNYRRLVKRFDGVTSLLAGDTVSYAQNTTYLVEISVLGSAIELSIDGELVFQAIDNDISTGSIAFYTWGNTDSIFEDLEVEDL